MNKVGRNDACPCDSGKKFKNCCLNDVENGKKIIRTFTRRDLIDGPYKQCPSCHNSTSFGVFMPISGSKNYTRECIKCGFEQTHKLPEVKKKLIYLDQFVVSNLIKLLDPEHPSHGKVLRDPFWKELFIKLERATKSQLIICPDSFYHKDESSVGDIAFRLLKRMYEHFSSGKTLYPNSLVQRLQIEQHFAEWLINKSTSFSFDPHSISFDRDLHDWSIGVHVSVGSQPRQSEVEELKKTNKSTQDQLKTIWKIWAKESDVSFEQKVRNEVLALGESSIKTTIDFERRQVEASYKIATDPSYQIDLNDILPPPSAELIQSLTHIARSHSIPEDEIPPKIVQYFTDYNALLEIPSIKISSVMFAGLARSAGLGEKKIPKSTADVQFISSYLPYCDALFVDKQSRKLLKELPQDIPNHLKLSEFKAKVFSVNQKTEFLDYLDQIVDEIPENQKKVILDVSGEDYAEPYWSIIQHEKREMRSNS